jgi:L-ribulose-5-phosphate 4-epimerase
MTERADAAAIDELRTVVCALHAELPRNGLVTWTSGNISGRVPGEASMVIKPSGITFDDLRPEHMVLCDLDGQVIDGTLKPSSDTLTHAAIYRGLPHIGGVVHTHSPYATAWAAVGREIPCILTAMADEFGGPVPLGAFAPIGNDAIGLEVVRVLRGHRSPAVLMAHHGVFTVGATPRDALKAAVMVEDVARTTFLAAQLGEIRPLPDDVIDGLHTRYRQEYGQ